MTISAIVIEDSVNEQGVRLTTFQLRYNRFIHSEVMTHRVFSRNASSSRAIPVKRMIEDIIADTSMPIHWGKNQPGMQANEEHNGYLSVDTGLGAPVSMCRELAWLEARDRAIDVARAFHEAGYHKQVVNRILEPFMHINVIVTATNFDNFYWLRRHKDAQPEIKALADAMYAAQMASTPKLLRPGEWHLPYVLDSERDYVNSHENLVHDPIPLTHADLLKISVARCARVSYKTHDGRAPRADEDLALYERLVGSAPLHASPAEHQASADTYMDNSGEYINAHLSGNFDPGFVQFRKTLDGEFCQTYEAA